MSDTESQSEENARKQRVEAKLEDWQAQLDADPSRLPDREKTILGRMKETDEGAKQILAERADREAKNDEARDKGIRNSNISIGISLVAVLIALASFWVSCSASTDHTDTPVPQPAVEAPAEQSPVELPAPPVEQPQEPPAVDAPVPGAGSGS
ncbi:hypothetical protein [Rhodococcus aetherivorans]|uniref:hypothetical protein n=1 Tax=Rhodococcus aetherivorans TaxID=191292 RepID=UPI0012610BB5|nr:hypothetical protein [Rhodococcus aetherivorans]NGP28890.1 hypothetical protein [Rhodococcus aetherivorans]